MSAGFKIVAKLLKKARKPLHFIIYAPWCCLYKCANEGYTDYEELLRVLQAEELKPEIHGEPFYYLPDFLLYENFEFLSQEDIDEKAVVKTDYRAGPVGPHRAHDNILDRLILPNFKNECMELIYNHREFTNRTSAFLQKIIKFQCSLTDSDPNLTQVPTMYTTCATKDLVKEPISKNSSCKYAVQPSEYNSNHCSYQEMSSLVDFYFQCNRYCNNLKPETAELISKFNGSSILGFKPTVHGEQFCFEPAGFATKTETNNFIRHIPGFYVVSCSSSSDDSWTKEPAVVVLSDSTFRHYIYQENVVVVMFYAPWCPHCHDMRPVFMEVARELKAEGWDSSAAIIDCSVNYGIADKYDITAFPTIKLFKFGRYVTDFSGKRSKEELKKFAIQYTRKKR